MNLCEETLAILKQDCCPDCNAERDVILRELAERPKARPC